MLGDAGVNDTQIVLAVIAFLSLLVGTAANTFLALRARNEVRTTRDENRSAHHDVATAIIRTHDAVAKVAEEIAPPGTTPVVEPVETPAGGE